MIVPKTEAEAIVINTGQIPEFLYVIRAHKRIITPWKKKNERVAHGVYGDGWNDCIKEMNKNHKGFMGRLSKLEEQAINELYGEVVDDKNNVMEN